MKAEDVIAKLEAWAPLVGSGYEVPAAEVAMHEAAANQIFYFAAREWRRDIPKFTNSEIGHN